MEGRITAEEKRRMVEFANTPKYRRTPEMLIPEEVADEELEE